MEATDFGATSSIVRRALGDGRLLPVQVETGATDLQQAVKIAKALGNVDRSNAWRPEPPIEIKVEWAWSEPADNAARIAGVTRVDARTASWMIGCALDVYSWPNGSWTPLAT